MVKKTIMSDPLQNAMQSLEKTTKTPTDYLTEQKDLAEKNLSVTKSLFSYINASGSNSSSTKIPKQLFIEQMDDEQIWQQLEIQNESFWEKCMSQTCKLLSLNESKLSLMINFPSKISDVSKNEENGSNINDEDSESIAEENSENESSPERSEEDQSEDEQSDGGEDGQSDTDQNNPKTDKTDDSFFNLKEMEAFLDGEDKKELNRLNGKSNTKDDTEDESEEIDYFDSLSSSDSEEEDGTKGKSLMFADFFDTENKVSEEEKRWKRKAERETKNKRKEKEKKEDLGIGDSESDDNDSENASESEKIETSEFDVRQQRLQNKINEMEEKALSEKPWQIMGEITSGTRPINSLLEEVLKFDSVSRPPPLITEETTLCLEDIIKRRIKSKVWDDVERKIKPVNDEQSFRKSLVLQQEKSKESLAQIYEKDYLEKIHKISGLEETKQDEPTQHTEIRKAMKDLFVKLDALSNFHFTSKPIAPEAKIITNIPAIEMEEVAPLAVSDANLLAPEEVKAKNTKDDIGKTERSVTDKKRERRKKKQMQKQKKIQDDKRIEAKEKLGIEVSSKEKKQQLMKQVTKNRNVIKGETAVSSNVIKSSKTFFTHLQDNVSTATKSKGNEKKKSKSRMPNDESSAKRFKL